MCSANVTYVSLSAFPAKVAGRALDWLNSGFWDLVGGPGQRNRHSDSPMAGRFGDRIPVEARFPTPLQPGPGAHSLLYNGYRVPFPGVKRQELGVNHPPHIAPMLKKEQSYTSTSLLGLRGLL